jgi:hypothetical protein
MLVENPYRGFFLGAYEQRSEFPEFILPQILYNMNEDHPRKLGLEDNKICARCLDTIGFLLWPLCGSSAAAALRRGACRQVHLHRLLWLSSPIRIAKNRRARPNVDKVYCLCHAGFQLHGQEFPTGLIPPGKLPSSDCLSQRVFCSSRRLPGGAVEGP